MGGCEGTLGAAVYADGGICLDILQNQWSPIYDVSAILTSIRVRILPGFICHCIVILHLQLIALTECA